MSQLYLQSLPYQADSDTLLKLTGTLPGAICLDSGKTRRREARYDILSALPSIQLEQHRRPGTDRPVVYQRKMAHGRWQPLAQVDIHEAAELLLLAHQPSNAVQEALAHLPFTGGLLGWLAYPAGQDRRSGYRDNYLSDNAARLQSQPEAGIGLYHWALINDHHLQQCTLFILPDCPPRIRDTVLARMMLTQSQPPSSADFALTGEFSPLTSRRDYEQTFDRLKQYILAGDCYQANLAICFQADFQGDPLTAYLALRDQSRSPFSAFIRHGKNAILSLSPERFLSVRGQTVTTQPIKGTRRRLTDKQADAKVIEGLTNSVKDQAENLMIVDLMRNDLGKVCLTGSVKTPELFTLHSFSHVHHLISTVTGQLPADISPLNLLKHCFPGGSITGAPKIRAMQIISELEAVPRSIYCGSVFYLDFNGNMDSSICIRTLLCDEQRIFCWGGGGIVADSQFEREYQECHDKVMALMQTLEQLK
ncbi:aminodeoxychorismate synthase component I [Pseudohongiella spirulinae]|uniref:aminodeoxychorismate synthase n=1 Tax=Pseudohongiella spirulinae TaxID=1249552 RepID=A0A0S2KDP2_9GAMM|nr:aminodeoxychorismate synthase component I [Pseudohongiella spirulinae]ALO46227.1 aminodeoxychorismate synthase [Pseudohongiella spirulinae]